MSAFPLHHGDSTSLSNSDWAFPWIFWFSRTAAHNFYRRCDCMKGKQGYWRRHSTQDRINPLRRKVSIIVLLVTLLRWLLTQFAFTFTHVHSLKTMSLWTGKHNIVKSQCCQLHIHVFETRMVGLFVECKSIPENSYLFKVRWETVSHWSPSVSVPHFFVEERSTLRGARGRNVGWRGFWLASSGNRALGP